MNAILQCLVETTATESSDLVTVQDLGENRVMKYCGTFLMGVGEVNSKN